MRIAALVGSSRRGNTYAMVESACHAISGECDVELIHLKDMSIAPCDGCLTCDDNGSCHIDDSMHDVIESMSAADGFIIGTPARWSLLSGELKTLIDRLNPLAVPELLKGKKAVIFTVGQSPIDDGDSIQRTCDSVADFCDNAGIEVVSTVLAYSCLAATDLIENSPEVLSTCKAAALDLYKALAK